MAIYQGSKKVAYSCTVDNSTYVVPVGTILPYAAKTPPTGFLVCDGSEVLKTTYADLFEVIGNTYGTATDTSKFKLPDLRDKFVQGANGNLGISKDAGLPNISGEVGYLKSANEGNYYQGINTSNGCFDQSANVITSPPAATTQFNGGTDSEGATGLIRFNASSSNSIYGNSDTVQPPSVCLTYIIKALKVGDKYAEESGTIIDDNEVGLTKTFSSDKISKTFATIEEVNKRITQYDVLPSPAEACVGQVAQFTGTTTEDYIHNYFYECVQAEGSYKWANVVVQNVPTKVSELTNDNNFVTEAELNKKGYLTEHQDISEKVDKEEGKSLIADSEITRLSAVKNYDDSVVKEDIATIKTDYATKTYVGEQITAADHLKREIVTVVPTAETATENVIYMLKVESTVGADKYKEYMLIDGEVACVGDTSVDLTDYAKKNEIPTELPANGGNADTVNTHTVASDVPEDAIFTDTVYDDTKVKEIITDLSSNLSRLKVGDLSGNFNLLNFNKCHFDNSKISISLEDNEITVNGDYYSTLFFDELLDIGRYSISFEVKSKTDYSAIRVLYDDNSYSDAFTKTFSIDSQKKLKGLLLYSSSSTTVGTSVYKNVQIEKGTTATSYEPYIPSVKMLAEENSQQSTEMMDIKMLGWSVPRECPIQNEVNGNQFIQKVGRVDLGSLDWTSVDTNTSLYTTSIKDIKILSNNIFLLGYSVTSYDIETSKMTNKNIKMSGLNKQDFYIKDDSYTDVSTFKQAMQGQYLYYELVTYNTVTIDGNEIGETVGDVRKETTVNLLNSILETTTSNGITCTNNGDGTYTLSGTKTTDTIWLRLGTVSLKANTSYKLIAQSPTYGTTDVRVYDNDGVYFGDGSYKGATPIITPTTDISVSMQIRVAETTALDNFIVKPMITTNLDATYDDFVSYTGGTGKLSSDVAQLQKTSAKASLYGTKSISVGQISNSTIGDYAIAFGEDANASGSCSYAHGYFVKAIKDYSHAAGYQVNVSGIYGYAHGQEVKATGSYSHAEGLKTTASGLYSHAEGYQTTASGECSYAEGHQTTASGQGSHAEGMRTIAAGSFQHVEGQYNIEDTENKYAHIIGKGTPRKKRNIYTVDWNGNAEYAGNVTATDSSGNKTSLLETIHKVYSMEIGNSAVDPVVVSDFKIDPGYRYLYIINGSGTAAYEIGILMFINGMKFVPLSSSDSATAIKDSVSAIGIDIYIEQGQLKVSRSATSYGATCVIYKLG